MHACQKEEIAPHSTRRNRFSFFIFSSSLLSSLSLSQIINLFSIILFSNMHLFSSPIHLFYTSIFPLKKMDQSTQTLLLFERYQLRTSFQAFKKVQYRLILFNLIRFLFSFQRMYIILSMLTN